MMTIEDRMGQLARWARMGNNRRGNKDMRTDETMQEDAKVQSEMEPEMVTGDEFPQEFGGGVETNSALAELEQLKGERDQLVDRLARLQAEFDNARKREARERADFRDFAVSGAVEQFLPVL